MSMNTTHPNPRSKRRQSFLRSFSISAVVALSLTMTAAQHSAKAEEPPASIETVTALKGPSTALENGVKGFALPAFFCTRLERTQKDRQLQELLNINKKWQKQIQEMVDWARSQRGKPVSAYYQTEIRQVTLLKAKLDRIARDIGLKRKELWQVTIKDCTNTATDVSMTAPESQAETETADPLAGIQFWQPRYYNVSAPAAPGRLCKEIDKLDYVAAVAAERANAGFNMNQADGVINDIEGHLKNATSTATRAALEAMLVTAKANLQKRIAELDAFDKLYADAQKLKVEDCFANDTEAAMADPLDESKFDDLGVEVHVPDLKEVTLIELPNFVCSEDERGRLMAQATVQSSRALVNVYEWQKRRDSIAEALRQGQGNANLLRQARYEADMEIGKRDIIHRKTQEIFNTARDLPLVDCSEDSDNRTSMGPVSSPSAKDQDALLSAINDMLFGPSPYISTGEVVTPYPTEPDDALIYDAEQAVHDRQRDIRHHERWQEHKERRQAAEHKAQGQHYGANTSPQETSTSANTKPDAGKNKKYGKGQKNTQVPTETANYETHRVGPLGFPMETTTVKTGETPQPEIVHEDIEYRTGTGGYTNPGKVYPPAKTTNPVLKAPSAGKQEIEVKTEAPQTEPQEQGGWVQVKPPRLVIRAGAADPATPSPGLQ